MARLRKDTQALALLGFHKVGVPPPGSWETWYNVPEATFLGFLQYLKENRWQVLDFAAFLRGLAAPASLPERAALLTFDDGYRTIVECAMPRLREFGYPGVLFVPTDFIGGFNEFDANTRWPRVAICGWDELRELERGVISVQSHGASHRAFSELDIGEVETELVRSKAVLEDGLGLTLGGREVPGEQGGIPCMEVPVVGGLAVVLHLSEQARRLKVVR